MISVSRCQGPNQGDRPSSPMPVSAHQHRIGTAGGSSANCQNPRSARPSADLLRSAALPIGFVSFKQYAGYLEVGDVAEYAVAWSRSRHGGASERYNDLADELPMERRGRASPKLQRTANGYGFGAPGVNVKERSNPGPRASPTTESGDRVVISTEGADLSPLDFFLEVMRDPEAPLNHRAKAARIAAQYIHPTRVGHQGAQRC